MAGPIAALLVIVLGFIYLIYPVFNVISISDLAIFHTFSYVANNVIFNKPGSFSINPEIAKAIPVESMPLLYPPGIYIITKLFTAIKDTQVAMNILILILQLISIWLSYILFRRISSVLVSFSLSLFLTAYIGCITVVVDSYIQPLLVLLLVLLIYEWKGMGRTIVFSLIALIVGAIWIIRQNVGLFIASMVFTWIFISNITPNDGGRPKGRLVLKLFTVLYLLCGLIALSVIRSLDGKIWYMSGYFIFFTSLTCYVLMNKSVGLRTRQMAREALFFMGPLLFLLTIWICWFGNTVGVKNYLYAQYIMPFHFINVFERSIFTHFDQSIAAFTDALRSYSPQRMYGGFQFLIRWGVLFFIPMVCNIAFAGYAAFKILTRKGISVDDLKIISLPMVGILACYPIESFWILSTKLIIVFLVIAYFLNKLYAKNRAIANAICAICVISSLITISVTFIGWVKREKSYRPVSEEIDIKLPASSAAELARAVNLIKGTIKNDRFYILDSYTDLEMYYGLIDYKYANFYIYVRRDCMNTSSEADLINALTKCQYVLINEEDYTEYQSHRDEYTKKPRSIGESVMKHVTGNYDIYEKYIRPKEVKDIWLSNFYLLKKKS